MTDERRPHGTRLVQPAANVDLYTRSRGSRHTRQRDRALQGGRKGAAGDLALPAIGYEHLLVRAQDAAALEQQAHELALRPARANRLERLSTDEGALTRLERHRPAEAGLEGMGTLVHVTAVEVHAGLQAQGIAGTQATRGDPGGIQCLPHTLGFRTRQHDLETIFARV